MDKVFLRNAWFITEREVSSAWDIPVIFRYVFHITEIWLRCAWNMHKIFFSDAWICTVYMPKTSPTCGLNMLKNIFRYAWYMLWICLRYAKDMPKIFLIYAWEMPEVYPRCNGMYGLLSKNVTQWLSEKVTSREAIASKNEKSTQN